MSKIECDDCKNNKKSNTYNNEFFNCITCTSNLCPLCKIKHNKTHIIIDYDSKDIICNIHNESFVSYCNKCKKNICMSCINKHKGHDYISFMNILPDFDKLMNEKIDLRKSIDKLKENINEIIIKLNNVGEILEIYYKIFSDLLYNYENKNRNYELIKSINEINNIKVFKELNEINNNNKLLDKCCNILAIYNKINDNKTNNNKEKRYENGKYVGAFKNGLREGKGIMYYNNGRRYEGDWKNDKYEGKGIEYYVNGYRYEGAFKNNKREAKGIMYYNDGDRYDGDWKSNNREGKGIYYYNKDKSNCNKYEGDYKNNVREGKGTEYYNNGNRYEGGEIFFLRVRTANL